MEISAHCSFCEHKEFDFAKGNLCGLTSQKADFIRKCSKITFDENAKEEIAKINLEYKFLQDQKTKVIGHLILFSIIGVSVILADIYFTQVLYEAGWISTGSVIGIAFGIGFIGYAFTPYIKYTNTNSVVKSQKQRMDNFFSLYDYSYDINYEDENYLTAVTLRRSKQKIR
ncbi:hypothetical protein [Kordia sp.]|uniref:hypothetical protein n=1 Tax=Kordia sp. TaxID=1965332 RepID=UPI003B5C0F93